MSKLEKAFSTAWKDLKTVTYSVLNYLAVNQTTVQAVVAEAGAVAVGMGASVTNVNAFSQLEEVVMGKVAAAAQDVNNHATLQQMFGDAWPTILATASALKNHPTVTTVTAALNSPVTLSIVLPPKVT